MSEELPLVSVIIPCRNEINSIGACLASVMSGDYPVDCIEIFVIDGLSDDGTRSAIEAAASRHPCIRILDNPKKIQAAALNLGIASAKGSVIIRMDAHCEYPANYISSLVRWLLSSGADNVGGVCKSHPPTDTAVARAIAFAMSHPLGVGNAHFRIGCKKALWVDTVPFGCYRRDVFERIGLFDEGLLRNEDEEYNYRLIRSNGRILLVPDVAVRYYVRDSYRKLWQMYFYYGYFKPLIVRKIGRVMTLRQLIPAAFVSLLAACVIAGFWRPAAFVVLAGVIGAYVLAISAVALTTLPRHGPACSARLFVVFPAMHFAYGLGFLKGVFDFLILRRSGVGDIADVPMSR
ncbi:MAG: glycosyltransferase family 2 protein [Pirellulales bacterium]|nr:glycosyltransferase family 2 protein [Pirellulales bacterium]